MRAAVKSEIEEALAAAWDAPDPEPESALRHVFAEDADGSDA
jgi:TPP-dependent pyruvate/acetoin dehydrogenase alpha subunit